MTAWIAMAATFLVASPARGPVRVSLLTARASSPTWLSAPSPPRQDLISACPGVALRNPVVSARLRSDGKSEDFRVARSTGCEAADQLVIDTVRNWTFQPAEVAGNPITVQLTFWVPLGEP